jgi:hypothetical protein
MRDHNLEEAIAWFDEDPSRINALATHGTSDAHYGAILVKWAIVRIGADRIERAERADRQALTDELPVTLSSVDDVAAVCLAHGLTQTDIREWGDTGIQVRADSDTWYLLLLDGGVGRGAELDYGYPPSLLVAAIEAARGGSR